MAGFLQEVFEQLKGTFAHCPEDEALDLPCCSVLSAAIEHVVDEINPRLRLVSGYARRLRSPVLATFRHIDGLVENVPGALLCSQDTFARDPRVNAFFVSPRHIQEIFSQSKEVRSLFDKDPGIEECWALLCFRKEERRQLGMSLVGDAVQHDVMQTAVSFTDHQVISPGANEEQARRTLKCCIFNGLLAHIRCLLNDAKSRSDELKNHLKTLRGRLQRASGSDVDDLQARVSKLELALAEQDPHFASLENNLDFVSEVLEKPASYLNASSSILRLSRLGIKLDEAVTDAGYEVPISQIQIASHRPRIGALVRFPRTELLPEQNFVASADLFLSALDSSRREIAV